MSVLLLQVFERKLEGAHNDGLFLRLVMLRVSLGARVTAGDSSSGFTWDCFSLEASLSIWTGIAVGVDLSFNRI